MFLNEGVVGSRGSGFRPTGHLSPSLTLVESPRDYLATSHFMDKLPAGTGFRLWGTPGETMVSPFTCEEDEDVFVCSSQCLHHRVQVGQGDVIFEAVYLLQSGQIVGLDDSVVSILWALAPCRCREKHNPS